LLRRIRSIPPNIRFEHSAASRHSPRPRRSATAVEVLRTDVLALRRQGRSIRQIARVVGVSRAWVHKLLHRPAPLQG